ncbi:MAG: hypothetical protein JWN43_1489 [Gammaproteobacteria bacterium]|nr:hypothetical protein [Gammaproteobacteria bacterium]
MPPSPHDELRRLEERLLDRAVRNDPEQVAKLLADDFVEFGSSGRIFDKAKTIDVIGDEYPVTRVVTAFDVVLLSPEVALVTYHIRRSGPSSSEVFCSLRSSVWQWSPQGWRMRFHQGTPTAVGAG